LRRDNVVALTAFNALRGAAVGGFMALLPMYMASLGYTMSMIGGAATAASVAVSFLLPATGYAIDSLGSRFVVILAGILLAVAPILPAYSTNIGVLAVSYALFLASFFMGQPARTAFLARSVEKGRLGYYIGATSMAFSLSRLAGPVAAGVSAERLGYKPSFIGIAALAAAGLAAFTALSLRPPYESRRPRIGLLEAYRSALKPPRSLAVILGFAALDRLSWSLWSPTLSAYLYKRGFSEAEVGGLVSLMGVSNSALLPVAGKAVDRGGAWIWMAASEALGASGAAILAFANGLWSASLALILIGASISTWIPSYNTLIARVMPGDRLGEAYSLANSVRGLAGAPGPYLGGLLYDSLSPAAPFAFSATMLLTASGLAATVLRRVELGAREEPVKEEGRILGAPAEPRGGSGVAAKLGLDGGD
jgi:MFS family permease